MKGAISIGFASIGVLLLVTAGASPPEWHPGVQLLTGLAFVAVSHVLTPCQDELTRWWKARILKRSGR
jgi:hypothetical protein